MEVGELAAETQKTGRATDGDIEAIVAGTHGDPSLCSGCSSGRGLVLRAVHPACRSRHMPTRSTASRRRLPAPRRRLLRRQAVEIPPASRSAITAANAGGDWDVTDPYSFGPVLGPLDDYYIGEGSHLRLFDKLGAHLIEHEGIHGTHFAVWAPNAQRVSVVGDFNDWDGRRHPMRHAPGHRRVGRFSCPASGPGGAYKFEIIGADGKACRSRPIRSPSVRSCRPATASVDRPPPFAWGDARYLATLRQATGGAADLDLRGACRLVAAPRRRRLPVSWDELADQLIPYVVDMGFTHIEFLPITEHPYDPSWGYQPTGCSRRPRVSAIRRDFARFVDGAHRAGIGVILDWVPAHFPTDEHGLAPSSTAQRSTSMPIRARASIRTGTPRSTISAGARWVASWSTTRSTGSRNSMSTGCASMRWPRCSISTTRARRASGCPTSSGRQRENLEAVASCRSMNAAVYGASGRR
jgi:1,4-alpha-glucan branching enzyme